MSDTKTNVNIHSEEGIDVTSESFEDSKGKKVEFVKIRVLKDRGNEVKVQYITLSPVKFKSLINTLYTKINKPA